MANSQIRVDIVADASKFEAAMKRADAAAGKFEHSTRDLGDSFEDAQVQSRGMADLLDGLATTMGFNVDGAISFSRGMADLSDGMKTTVIPALKGATARVKEMSAAFRASPHAKLKLGLIGVAAAAAAMAASSDEGKASLQSLYDGAIVSVNKGLNGTLKWINKIGNAIPGLGGQFESEFEKAEKAAKKAAAATAAFNRQLQLAMQFGGSLEDPDGMFASMNALNDPDFLRSVDPVFIAQEWEDDMDDFGAKASKATKKAVDKVGKAAQDAYSKIASEVRTDADKFRDAVSMRDSIKGQFGLDFSDDIGHDVIESLRRQVAKFQDFVRGIARLRKMRLPESLVRQFVAAGPGALDQMNRINSGNIGEIRKLAGQAEDTANAFSKSETMRQTGVNPDKPIVIKMDGSGLDSVIWNELKKRVRVEGGGNVQLAMGGK